jgi:hypothetical protein
MLHSYHWSYYDWDDDQRSVIDAEGDLVVYAAGNGWPSFGFWLVPGTELED